MTLIGLLKLSSLPHWARLRIRRTDLEKLHRHQCRRNFLARLLLACRFGVSILQRKGGRAAHFLHFKALHTSCVGSAIQPIGRWNILSLSPYGMKC